MPFTTGPGIAGVEEGEGVIGFGDSEKETVGVAVVLGDGLCEAVGDNDTDELAVGDTEEVTEGVAVILGVTEAVGDNDTDELGDGVGEIVIEAEIDEVGDGDMEAVDDGEDEVVGVGEVSARIPDADQYFLFLVNQYLFLVTFERNI